MRISSPKMILALLISLMTLPVYSQKIFDVHLHGSPNSAEQVKTLQQAGVYKAAISSSWELQNSYRNNAAIPMLYGLMFPCPDGKVPYSLQACYGTGNHWPELKWVEQQIKEGNIDYFGEILNQYYGISPMDSLFIPYYILAQHYALPVGIHTGGAGPDHGSPNFNLEMGNPLLLKPLLQRFPKLKLWIMHGGVQWYKETIAIMQQFPEVYTDISVISNPDIIPSMQFIEVMNSFIKAGLEDRLMFGTDNGDIAKIVAAIEALGFLSKEQKTKLYYQNAEHFFRRPEK